MLRACELTLKGNWDDHLPLIEFAYNSNYQSSIKMTQFEAYMEENGSPIWWDNMEDKRHIGPNLVQETT